MGTAHASHDNQHGGEHHGGEHHSVAYYVRIYLILLVLLIISILGPELGIRPLTLITAFGIAVVKAAMVCAYFMHLNIEKRFVWYMLYAMLLLVAVFFAGVATDIMKPTGQRWENKAALQLIEQHKAPAADAAPAAGQNP